MADSRISDLAADATPAGTDQFAGAQSGSSLRYTLAQVQTFATTAPTFTAGSSSAGTWPKFTAGTLLSTAEDGALEMDADCLYACTAASGRGVVPIEHIIRADSTRTFTSNTSPQAIFNSPSNGALTLETGAYMFECVFGMDTMSATSGNGNFGFLGAGTAGVGSILYQLGGFDAASNTTTSFTGVDEATDPTSVTNIISGSTATELYVYVEGTFEVTSGGTIIPSFTLKNASAAVVKVGSYFLCRRIGSTSMVSVGQWS